MSLTFRECTKLDLDELVNISRDTFIAAFEEDNDPADFKNYIDFAFNKEKLQSELENKNSRFYFVLEEEELVGYFKLNENEAQTEVKSKDSFELERIYVVRAHQGKKIGAWILQQVLKLTKQNGKDYLWLGVWEKNAAAIRFYQRHGFKKFGTHPYYIGKDKQTDWLLRLEL
ncbi:GNAT family N-acetyltransferase [Flagellimonas aquimarina]|jgi:ribosomal protein S18 acetylase RimI-like enzyme|uniref:GNAT family N-acetyltransferase n=1 Tax=Flagellimonas aquimarina TaxID=2201895 RepID=A0A316LI75_9FLAO|nr:GNAT family N-acetyltransferase [Allomuricauda koreensis]PWL39780.1 GNAT family N-acetyltransferase [Allomuricauda koreensis]